MNSAKTDMFLFPNPAKDILTVSINEKQNIPDLYEIYDLMGQKIKYGIWGPKYHQYADWYTGHSFCCLFLRCVEEISKAVHRSS